MFLFGSLFRFWFSRALDVAFRGRYSNGVLFFQRHGATPKFSPHAPAEAMEQDGYLKDWWQSMVFHLPALRRATEKHAQWASAKNLTKATNKKQPNSGG